MEAPVTAVRDIDGDLRQEIRIREELGGAGINLKTGRPKPDAIRDAVRKVLSDGRYKAGSQRIGSAIAASPGVDGLIDEMEAMLREDPLASR